MKSFRNGEVDRVDIILDNSGLELFVDLTLAELLIGKCGVKKVVFHGKVCTFIKYVGELGILHNVFLCISESLICLLFYTISLLQIYWKIKFTNFWVNKNTVDFNFKKADCPRLLISAAESNFRWFCSYCHYYFGLSELSLLWKFQKPLVFIYLYI